MYADDTNLLVTEHLDCQSQEEFGHVKKWAFKNNMIINKAKNQRTGIL